jgi:hypothetical protein
MEKLSDRGRARLVPTATKSHDSPSWEISSHRVERLPLRNRVFGAARRPRKALGGNVCHVPRNKPKMEKTLPSLWESVRPSCGNPCVLPVVIPIPVSQNKHISLSLTQRLNRTVSEVLESSARSEECIHDTMRSDFLWLWNSTLFPLREEVVTLISDDQSRTITLNCRPLCATNARIRQCMDAWTHDSSGPLPRDPCSPCLNQRGTASCLYRPRRTGPRCKEAHKT